jgi:hypothetical protein
MVVMGQVPYSLNMVCMVMGDENGINIVQSQSSFLEIVLQGTNWYAGIHKDLYIICRQIITIATATAAQR